MFEKIIRFSVNNKLIVFLIVVVIIVLGILSMQRIPIDAQPDITNNQVQVVTVSQTLAAQEVEQFITFPIEMSMANIPRVEEIRSISRFGLSVVTIVFDDGLPILDARQYVREQLSTIGDAIPAYLGSPEMMPITSGLGEIYQYTLNVEPGFEDKFDPMEVRTIQDWIVKRQLMGTKGIVDVSSFGGYVKQFEVAVDPLKIAEIGITMDDVFVALEANNQNSGGSYIEKNDRSFYIRSQGIVKSLADIENIVIENRGGIPVKIKEVATVRFGSGVRFGAMTMDGKGEVVGGITLMLKGGNSSEAISSVHERIEQIRKSLPEGITIEPFLDRSVLVGKAIHTVTKNLIEGGIIVILILILMLGNFRAGLVVASVIPLSMLFAFIMMDLFGVSANLMSLGAIDFGIVVDGAVIIIEAILHALLLSKVSEMNTRHFNEFIAKTSAEIYKTAAFGVMIILVVFVPIMTLTGIEGKMFRPMAQTFSFAILGAFILTLTYVPMMSSIFLRKVKVNEDGFSERFIKWLQKMYYPTVEFVLNRPKTVVGSAVILLVLSVFTFSRMGAVFIPTLEEGDLAMQMALEPGSSLSNSIETSSMAEKILIENFPEVKHVVSKIGTAEVPTDPMGIEDADIMIILKEREEWTTTQNREELISMMKTKLEVIDWATFEFTQPIQLRFNELITGSKTDIAVKIFGEDMDILREQAVIAAAEILKVRGAGDVKVEQTDGLSQLLIDIDRSKCAQYGVNTDDVNRVIRTAYAGEKSGVVYEGERRFDLVVRLDKKERIDFNLHQLFVHTKDGKAVPVSELSRVTQTTGPVQIQREDAKRRITIGINVRDRDVESLVNEINDRLETKLNLPPGYYLTYGGAFENLQSAKQRLMIAVPAALLMILILLYIAFGSIKDTLLIFSAVPLSTVGGIYFLYIRGLPFSISAGVGFIALFGVAVLNGIVLIGYFRNLIEKHPEWSLRQIIEHGSIARLRPVLMTALVAMLGFIPMAFSTSEGAEVQKPLATVVIGGLVTSTLLTLVVLPAIYYLAYRKKFGMSKVLVSSVLMLLSIGAVAQTPYTLDQAKADAIANNLEIKTAEIELKKAEANYKAALDLGKTDIGLQYGEINAPNAQDYYFSVTQNFGNLAAIRAGRLTNEKAIEVAKSQLEIAKRKSDHELTLAYVNWAVSNRKLLLVNTVRDQISELVSVADIRLSVGEISDFEYNAFIGIQSQIDLEIQTQTKGLIDASGVLSKLTQAAVFDLQPEFLSELINKEDTLGVDPNLAQAFKTLVDLQNELAQMKVNLSKSAYVPDFHVGYFNQQIEGYKGLQGISAGLSIPLWHRAQKQDVVVSKLDSELQAANSTQFIFMLNNELSMANVFYQQTMEQWRATQKHSDTNTMNIVGKAIDAFNAGEIEYYEFVQFIQTTVNTQITFIEIAANAMRSKADLMYYIQ